VSAAQEAVALIQAELDRLIGGAYITSLITGDSLAQGLRDKKYNAGQAAADVAQGIRANLEGVDGYTIGRNVGGGYGQGLGSMYAYVFSEAERLKNAVRHHLEFAGSPAYAHSREMGEMVGKTWGQGLSKGLGALPDLGGKLPGAMSGFAGAAAGGGINEIHTHIYLDGREIAEAVDRHNYYQRPTYGTLPRN
jgi:hypothetical protein